MASAEESKRLIIATRESPLALWQAEHIAALLRQAQPGLQVELLGMTTTGDQLLSSSLAKVGGKGLFVKELEAALQERRADIAVHSAKDVPMELLADSCLRIVDRRADPRDALVLPASVAAPAAAPTIASVDDLLALLPDKPVIGTSSLRRQAALRKLCAGRDVRIEPLRGNVQTRLGKLDGGDYDAIILAAAGLERLGLEQRQSAFFSTDMLLPAPAQAALAVEYLQHQQAWLGPLLDQLVDPATALCVAAERAYSRALEGGCQLPVAAHAVLSQAPTATAELTIRGSVLAPDGSEQLLATAQLVLPASQSLADSTAQAELLGADLAGQLIEQGATRLLAPLTH